MPFFVDLRYFEEFEKRIPRAEMEKMEVICLFFCYAQTFLGCLSVLPYQIFFLQTLILGELEKIDTDYIGTICGSYRRG